MDLIKVGTITTTHGIKGEVKVMGDDPCFSPDFKSALYIGEKMIEVHISQVKVQGDHLLVTFKEFNDINQVEGFKNFPIYADRETLEPLGDFEFYYKDLIGLEVYNQKDEYKGVVSDVIKYPQCDYLVVKDDKKEYLIPFIEEFISDVTDIIIVKEIEGLFV